MSTPYSVIGRPIRFLDLEERFDLSGGFIEVQGLIPRISNAGEIVRVHCVSLRWSPDPQIFFSVKFSHVLKPEARGSVRWNRIACVHSRFYYPSGWRDFFYGPFLHNSGAISCFYRGESHFITIFPKGVFIPRQPIEPEARQNIWKRVNEC